MSQRPHDILRYAVRAGRDALRGQLPDRYRGEFRAVATRFDKLAVRYQATVCVADIFIWLRASPDQPRSDPRNRP